MGQNNVVFAYVRFLSLATVAPRLLPGHAFRSCFAHAVAAGEDVAGFIASGRYAGKLPDAFNNGAIGQLLGLHIVIVLQAQPELGRIAEITPQS